MGESGLLNCGEGEVSRGSYVVKEAGGVEGGLCSATLREEEPSVLTEHLHQQHRVSTQPIVPTDNERVGHFLWLNEACSPAWLPQTRFKTGESRETPAGAGSLPPEQVHSRRRDRLLCPGASASSVIS